jgi:hypothetical protein
MQMCLVMEMHIQGSRGLHNNLKIEHNYTDGCTINTRHTR